MKDLLKKALIVVIVLTVAVAFGFVVGKKSAGNEASGKHTDSEASIYSDSSDLRKSLNITLAEHVALTSDTLRASYDEHDGSTALVDELDKNSQELAEIVGDFYGDEPKATFLKLWRDHITYFVNYTVSAKNNDKEGKEQALSDLEEYSQAAAEFFSGLNGDLTVDSLKPLFAEYRDTVVEVINNYADSKYVESLDKESQAFTQAGKIADSLSDGIIKQFPDRLTR